MRILPERVIGIVAVWIGSTILILMAVNGLHENPDMLRQAQSWWIIFICAFVSAVCFSIKRE